MFDKTINNSLLKKISLLKTRKSPKNNKVKYTNGDGSWKLISIYKIISINSIYKKQYIVRRIIDIPKRIVKLFFIKYVIGLLEVKFCFDVYAHRTQLTV